MDKEDAIKYLQKKGIIMDDEHPEFDEDDEKEIETIMKSGKVYGDPVCEINHW